MCALNGRLAFGRSRSLDVNERVYERDLELDLFTAQFRRSRQGANLSETTGELCHSLYQGRTLQRPPSRFAPQTCGLPGQSGLAAMTREQFRLVLANLAELAFKGFGNASMKRASRLAK